MAKLAKNLKRGEIIVIQTTEDAPESRLIVTSNQTAIGTLEQDNRKIGTVQLDNIVDATMVYSFITDGDSEFETVELLPIGDKLIPNDFAIAIAEEAHRAGFIAACSYIGSSKTRDEVTAEWHKAWSDYEPSERVKDMTS